MKVTQEERRELKEAFDFTDSDSNSKIDFVEFVAMLEGLEAGIDAAQAQSGFKAVDIDGDRIGRIIRAPHRVALPQITGDTTLDITCFGDRINTFGPLHNCNPQEYWWGPPSYRTRGEHWTDGYLLRSKGIFVAPILEGARAQ